MLFVWPLLWLGLERKTTWSSCSWLIWDKKYVWSLCASLGIASCFCRQCWRFWHNVQWRWRRSPGPSPSHKTSQILFRLHHVWIGRPTRLVFTQKYCRTCSRYACLKSRTWKGKSSCNAIPRASFLSWSVRQPGSFQHSKNRRNVMFIFEQFGTNSGIDASREAKRNFHYWYSITFWYTDYPMKNGCETH